MQFLSTLQGISWWLSSTLLPSLSSRTYPLSHAQVGAPWPLRQWVCPRQATSPQLPAGAAPPTPMVLPPVPVFEGLPPAPPDLPIRRSSSGGGRPLLFEQLD